jgi:hypothetical protein
MLLPSASVSIELLDLQVVAPSAAARCCWPCCCWPVAHSGFCCRLFAPSWTAFATFSDGRFPRELQRQHRRHFGSWRRRHRRCLAIASACYRCCRCRCRCCCLTDSNPPPRPPPSSSYSALKGQEAAHEQPAHTTHAASAYLSSPARKLHRPDQPTSSFGRTVRRYMSAPLLVVQRLREPSSVSRAFPSWNRSILTEIYLCHAYSYQ